MPPLTYYYWLRKWITSSTVNNAGHLSFTSSTPDYFVTNSCLRNEMVLSIFFLYHCTIVSLPHFSQKWQSVNFQNIWGLSSWNVRYVVGFSSPRSLDFFLQAMHPLELWISTNLQVIQHIQCPSPEYGSYPFLSSAAVSIRSNHCMNWVQRGMDSS